MKKVFTIALGIATLGTAASSFAAVDNQLRGSDTLETMSEYIIAACNELPAMLYIGGGSTNGEQAMLDGDIVAPNNALVATQEVSPMSRFLAAARTCRAPDPKEAEGLLVALDGLAILEEDSNNQCASEGVAFNPSCIDVADLNGVAGAQCPGCETGNTQYCFSNEFDALRVLFTGMHKNGGSTIANQDCNSDVRHSLVASWDNLHDGSCATGECTELKHAWRRDDLSGTTDAFLSILGLPAITAKPFCNGTGTEEKDPIRRSCSDEDLVCNPDGKSGLVLPIFVPELDPAFIGNEYATVECRNGKFGLAGAKITNLGGGVVKRDCAEKDDFSIAGFCLAPQTTSGNFACNSKKDNPNVFFANLSDDARLFNKWVRNANGDLVNDAAGRPETFGWHKMRLACQEQSATLNIGCLAGDYDCTWGFAGREAEDAALGSNALKVKNVEPTDASVRKLLITPVPSDKYPLARGLYYNSLVGFENVLSAQEAALTTCFADQTNADAAAIASGFVTLGGIAPRCDDFNETSCDTQVFKCDTNADCGAVGACVGGNPATTTTMEGTCDQSCVTSANCSQGRTCNASGRCVFGTNTNACL